MEDRFVRVNGVRLHVVDWGGDGPVAFLHHATGFHARVMDPIARFLADRYHVIGVDARGHGDSDKPEHGYRWEVFIHDTVALLDELGIAGAVGIGHSFGATTVLGAAAERPDLFRALVLLDPIFFPREFRSFSDGENPMAEAARKRREVWASREEMFESYRSRPPFATWREEFLRSYVDHGTEPHAGGGVRLKCPGAVEAEVFGMAPEHDAWRDCDRVTAPTLVIRGERSTALSDRDAAAVVARLRRGRMITIAGAGHFVPQEAPEAVLAAIDGFLADSAGALPIATQGMAHLALRVADLERSAAFYRDVFGMRVAWQPDPDNVYLTSGRDNLALHRAAVEPRSSTGALDHLGFLVATPGEVFTAAEAVARSGIPLLRPARRHRDGSCSFYVEDPEGNVVQVLYVPETNSG
ncbi:MAG: hypothetical protein QOD06_2665 [Candidatus Binatota bacterium]|nr:hypothetical protein [Candidatus Binatota bacterium]